MSPAGPGCPISCLELVGGLSKRGYEGGVRLPETLPGSFRRGMVDRRRRLLGLIRTTMRILPQDRLSSQRPFQRSAPGFSACGEKPATAEPFPATPSCASVFGAILKSSEPF
jgi:hypothetical protein